MRRPHFIASAVAIAAAFCLTPSASGQCSTYIDFEDYPDGTTITSQYDGVHFSTPPGFTCPPEIEIPGLPTSSGTRALYVPACPEFSSDYLRMIFDDAQEVVSFTIGEWGNPDYPMMIRAYDTPSGTSGLIFSETIDGGNGVNRLVTIGAADGPANIRRVEVESIVSGVWECIDDLRFARPDHTPPDVRIDEPLSGSCLCSGDVTIIGIACDDDGGYDRDRLEYRPSNAPPGDPWILIREYVGQPVCEPFPLFTWDTTVVPHGRYDVRAVATNACGLQDFAFISVLIDKAFNTIEITSPPDSATVCGVIEFRGSAHDGCACFDSYIVEYGLTPSGPFQPVDPAHPVYDVDVKNGILATWDTAAAGLPDDTYYVRVVGTDSCGNTQAELIKLHLESDSPACGCPADVNGDGEVTFNDLISLLAAWGPCL